MVDADSVKLMVATTPFATVLVLMPQTTQVETPAALLQLIDFDAAEVAAPVVTVKPVKSLVA